MSVPTTWIKFDKSCKDWRGDGVSHNAVLIAIGLEKLWIKKNPTIYKRQCIRISVMKSNKL